MTKKIERRKHPRVKDSGIGVQLSGEGVNAITQSLDVSASGIYCKVDRHIPVMTKVEIALTLPGKGGKDSVKNMNIEGVVVREHPVKENGKIKHYDVAIFFHTLLPKERKVLVDYINKKNI